MWISDMPNVPPQNVPVLIAQANQAKSGDITKIRTIGVCKPSPNQIYSLDNVINPLAQAETYLRLYENRNSPGLAVTTILQQPKHGVLRLVTEEDRGVLFSSSSGPIDPADPGYAYLPDSDYLGRDSATIQVDYGNGLKINVKYFFQAIDGILTDNWMEQYCSKTGYNWKISANLDANGNTAINSQEYQPTDGTSSTINPVLITRFDSSSTLLSATNLLWK